MISDDAVAVYAMAHGVLPEDVEFDDDGLADVQEWLKEHDSALLEKAAALAESNARPLPGYGDMNHGSRSLWYSRGTRDSATRIRGLK